MSDLTCDACGRGVNVSWVNIIFALLTTAPAMITASRFLLLLIISMHPNRTPLSSWRPPSVENWNFGTNNILWPWIARCLGLVTFCFTWRCLVLADSVPYTWIICCIFRVVECHGLHESQKKWGVIAHRSSPHRFGRWSHSTDQFYFVHPREQQILWSHFFFKKLKNVSCEYDRLSMNGWNSTLQAALDVLILYFIYDMVFVN